MGVKRKVKVKMICTAYVTINDDGQGNIDIEDVDAVENIENYEVIDTDRGDSNL